MPIDFPVKVLLLSPTPAGLYRGPAETALRYRQGLQRRGHLCELLGGDDGDCRESLAGTLQRFKPDLVHAHDAFRCGLQLLGLRVPWIVSVTGDDVYRDLRDERVGPLVCETLRRAHRVLVPTASCASWIEEAVPDSIGRVDVVPRAAQALPTGGTDLRRSLGIPRNRLLILLPGGLRPIKGQDRAFSLIGRLREHDVDAELVIVGPDQDPAFTAGLIERAEEEPRIRVLPALSRERMGAAYQNADVVLNTSLDEGMSLTILEAGMHGRPVVASDVPGNRELIRHRETGLLFRDEDELASCVLAVSRNRAAAGALGVRMREDFKRRFDADREIDLLLSAYAAA
ncbi:MAG: glycosyltransferase family 4 protein [Planctomycetes bacterium]|nr:glycosyltransferase family 4 protein [Planctomycetota bacterium]